MRCSTPAHVPSTVMRQFCGLLSGHRSTALKDDEAWRKLSERSCQSEASTCPPDYVPEATDSESEDACCLPGDRASETVPLCTGLFFYDPCQPESLGEQRRLLPASYIKKGEDGELRVGCDHLSGDK